MGRIVVGNLELGRSRLRGRVVPAGPARPRPPPWYAERFEGVEVNSTFYAVPGSRRSRRWAELTPPGFTFDVKLHRLLSRHSAGLDSLPQPCARRRETTARGRVRLDDRLQAALADARRSTRSRR